MAYINKETSPEVAAKVLEILTIAKDTGVVKKGANEVTKSIEKGNAQLVVIAGDVTPPEIVVHIPSLCVEKGIAYEFITTKQELGNAIGISVGCAAAAIQNAGNASELLRDILDKEKKKTTKVAEDKPVDKTSKEKPKKAEQKKDKTPKEKPKKAEEAKEESKE
jgi:large subunit ribosomal protein L7Ae